MNPRNRIVCKCGNQITANTFKKHLQSNKCNRRDTEEILKILELKTLNRNGWLKKLELEAVADQSWFLSVINSETKIEDWSFECPRPAGQVPPSKALSFSLARTGASNPSCVERLKRIAFSKEEVIKFGEKLYEKFVLNEEMQVLELIEQVKTAYPDYIVLFSNDFKYKINKHKQFFLLISKLSEIEYQQLLLKRRGINISIGQKKSLKHQESSSRLASQLLSKWRTTIPHQILFNMISELDLEAKIEFKHTEGNKSYSYDIYSPLINSFIEMHGHFWHEPKTIDSSKLQRLLNKNLENDKIKENIANKLDKRYVVFWDNDIKNWKNQIEKLYGKRPTTTVQEIEDKIGKKLRSSYRF